MLDEEDESALVTVIGGEEVLTERLLISFDVAFVITISKLPDDTEVDNLEEDNVGEDEVGSYSVGEDDVGSPEELLNLAVVETD